MQEPSLPLHLQSVWGYNSDRVGLVYMAGLVPALICEHLVAYGCSRTNLKLASPLSGLLADRIGSDYITSICLLLALPWWIVLALRKSIALFVVALAMQCEHRVLACVLVLMHTAFRFLCLGCGSSGNCRAGNCFSENEGCWMQVTSTFMYSLTDYAILQMPMYMELSISPSALELLASVFISVH